MPKRMIQRITKRGKGKGILFCKSQTNQPQKLNLRVHVDGKAFYTFGAALINAVQKPNYQLKDKANKRK